jgi:hypothetical protein
MASPCRILLAHQVLVHEQFSSLLRHDGDPGGERAGTGTLAPPTGTMREALAEAKADLAAIEVETRK